MDIITPEKRSWNMSRIRGKSTRPELAVRSALHRMGYRFRISVKNLPGKPDVVLPKYKTAIFVHGCFWHRHHGCKYAYTPKSRTDFWSEKFRQNLVRDKQNLLDLKKTGWLTVVIWECEIKFNVAGTHSDLSKLLRSRLVRNDMIGVEGPSGDLNKIDNDTFRWSLDGSAI